MSMIISDPVTITLGGKSFVLHNTLQTRKDFCIKFGGIRPVIQAAQDVNQYMIAQIIAVASGKPKKVEQIFELVVSESMKSVSEQLSDYVVSLMGDDDDEDSEPGNDQATENQ